ncbi:MAG TPA: hypothetical protein VK843_06195 [Planctomycetota bacterium]|nr:hypothetical protein [Planctomycetota bacterium]
MQMDVMKRLAFVGALVFATPAIALAQSSAILGRDDGAFARQLYERGWTDLAEGVIKAYEKLDAEGKADPLAVLDMQAIGLDLRLDVARRDSDLVRRKQVITEVIAAKEKLVSEHPRTQVGRDTRDNLPDAYRMLGESLTAALAKESDPAKVTTLREEGEAAFARAETGLKERLATLKELRIEENQAAADVQYMNALFNLGRTHYFHSRFYPAADPKRGQLLASAISTFEDFSLDYGDRLLNVEGMYYIGLCYKSMSQYDDAFERWDYVISVREGYEQDAQGRYDVMPEVADLISRSALQKVLLLTETGKPQEAIEAADDFWTKIPDPATAGSGLAVLAAKADAQLAANDAGSAGDTARQLIALDPSGPWGSRGREVLGRMIGGASGASIGPEEILRVAQTDFGQGKFDQTLDDVQHVLQAAKGDAKEQDYGSSALYLMGQVYAKRGWFHEASLVFDTAFELYPRGADAPNAIAAAMDCYARLNRDEKRPFYKSRQKERGQSLTAKYPTHPAAASVQLGEARELVADGKFVEAAKLFQGVPPGAVGYEEAEVGAGNALYRQGIALAADKKPAEAKAAFTQAETTLKKAMADLATAKSKSLDPAVLARYSGAEYTALMTLASIYVQDAVGRPEDVLKTLEGADERFANDSKGIEGIWTLRIRAQEKLGKLEEAITQFDALLVKQSDHTGLAGAAGVLARALDQRALDILKADASKTEAADSSWHKAVGYYLLSVQPQLDTRANAKFAELEAVAKRLLEIGMRFNGVAEESNSFVGWRSEKTADTQAWEKAAQLYEVVVELDPANYRARIGYGRALGFLARWKDAAAAYASLFDQEKLLKPDKSGFNPEVVSNRPELVNAYLEWGVCEAETGLLEKSADRQARASEIFDKLVANTLNKSPLWWNAKYHQIRTLYERGMYEPADVGIGTLERVTAKDFADAPTGLKALLIALRTDISKKVVKR